MTYGTKFPRQIIRKQDHRNERVERAENVRERGAEMQIKLITQLAICSLTQKKRTHTQTETIRVTRRKIPSMEIYVERVVVWR